MKKRGISFRLSMKITLFATALLAIDCSSKISLWREWPRPIDSQIDRGVLEISVDNSKNKKIETVYIKWLVIYDQDFINKPDKYPPFFQIHYGELDSNLPYEMKIAPGEYFLILQTGVDPFDKTELEFPFIAYFGFHIELGHNTNKLVISDYKEPICSTISQSNVYRSERRCQKIVIKKDITTKIIIHAQPEDRIKHDMGMKAYAAGGRFPIILPQDIKIRETPEVLIEVQNPK